jgi:Invasion associated locus B (IalB) protein
MRMKTLYAAAALSTALPFALAGAAFAQSPSQIGKFQAWGAYSYVAGGGKVCYVLTVPATKKPDAVDHGDNFFLVSQKPGQNVSFEPQFMAGYELKANTKVTLTIDARSFTLFTSGKSAWMENAAEEPQLIAAMKTGKAMSVAATSKRGTATNYTYSLKGISKALDAIKVCK